MRIELTGMKPANVPELIFSLLDILEKAGIPLAGKTDRRLERMAEACLAVGGIRTSLAEAASADEGVFLKTRDIISFMNQHYGEEISPGSYDDIRRKDLILPVEAGLVLNSSAIGKQATNNPTRGYALSPHFARLLKAYGQPAWDEEWERFLSETKRLRDELERKRQLERIPVRLPSGEALALSAGEHNELQRQIIESFLPLFGFGAQVLYVGDTTDKFLYRADDALQRLGFFTLEHDELPDVVAYSEGKNLLYLVEAVHSAGPMDEIRVRRLKRQLAGCRADIVFVTAFLTRKEFRRWAADIAWETEVWIADSPEHLIHFNGYKFLEIHK